VKDVGKTWLTNQIISILNSNKHIQMIYKLDNYNSNENYIYKNKIIYKYNFNSIIELQANPDSKYLLLIIDNYYDKNNESLEYILANSYHYKISIILIIQYPISLSVKIRSNFDYVFIYKENNISNLKRLYEYYLGIIPTFKIFNDLNKNLSALTKYIILYQNDIFC
jgi:hypothetical protein